MSKKSILNSDGVHHVSCCICGTLVSSAHRHYVTEKNIQLLRNFFDSVPAAQGNILLGQSFCCAHLVPNHLNRIRQLEANMLVMNPFVDPVSLSVNDRQLTVLAKKAQKRRKKRELMIEDRRIKRRRSLRLDTDVDQGELPALRRFFNDAGFSSGTLGFADDLAPMPFLRETAEVIKRLQAQVQQKETVIKEFILRTEAVLIWSNLKDDEVKLKVFTGLTLEEFGRVTSRYSGSVSMQGRKEDGMSNDDRVLLAMAWLGRCFSKSAIAILAARALRTVGDSIDAVMKVLSKSYEDELKLPTLAETIANTPQSFRENCGNYLACVIPDGTSLQLNSPLRSGKSFFTVYKGHHSFRYFVVVDIHGRILYVSELASGSMIDESLWSESSVEHFFKSSWEPEFNILNSGRQSNHMRFVAVGGDKGYSNLKIDTGFFRLLVTESGAASDELKSQRMKDKTKKYSSAFAPYRSVVERTIRRMKLFERLGSKNNCINQLRVLSDAVKFVAGFHNEELRIGNIKIVHY